MHLHFFAKLFTILQFSVDHKTSNMSRIEELEPEYLDFIKRKEQTYGTPIVFTKPHEFDKLKAYIKAVKNSPHTDLRARIVQSYRYILFPTMVVKLKKYNTEVFESETLRFEEFGQLDMILAKDVNQNIER